MLRTFCSPLFPALPDFDRLVSLTMDVVLLTRKACGMLVSICFKGREVPTERLRLVTLLLAFSTGRTPRF
jgi:hypothetical protein